MFELPDLPRIQKKGFKIKKTDPDIKDESSSSRTADAFQK